MRHKTEKMKLSEQGVVSEEALLAYLNNQLTAEDKQQLEKLLADDPFAQEALEGLQQTNKATAAVALGNINKKVRERVGIKEARMVKMHWTTYAWAAVVFGLLVGVGFLMVTYMGNNHNSPIAMNDPAQQQNINLLEEKKESPNLESATAPVVTDSNAISIQPTEMSNTPATLPTIAAADNNTQAPRLEPNAAGTVSKTIVPQTATNQQALSTGTATNATTGNSRYNMNSTILADDKGTAPAAKPAAARPDLKQTATSNVQDNVSLDQMTAGGSKNDKKATEQNQKAKEKQVAGYTTQPVVRGSIVENEEVDRVTVITMDDAMKSFNSQDYKKAGDQFGEILKQQPNNADALYFGGISDYINGNAKKSEKNFDKLLKEGTKYSEGSKWYKANILLKKGKRDDAKKLLDELANSGGSYKERAIKKKAEMEF